MKRGKTEAETCHLNGWTVGTVLVGDEGYGPHTITITAIGRESILAYWHDSNREAPTTLICREWSVVHNDSEVSATSEVCDHAERKTIKTKFRYLTLDWVEMDCVYCVKCGEKL